MIYSHPQLVQGTNTHHLTRYYYILLSTACFRSAPCNSKTLFSFARLQVIWSLFNHKTFIKRWPFPGASGHKYETVRSTEYYPSCPDLPLRLHVFGNNIECQRMQRMGRLGRLGKKKRKNLRQFQISYGARDCHSLFPHPEKRFGGKASAWDGKSWLSCLFFDTISDLVTMTIGMYKLVTVVEINSECRIRSSTDPTGCNDKTT